MFFFHFMDYVAISLFFLVLFLTAFEKSPQNIQEDPSLCLER